jgi:uncharacterized protein (TIGR02001 family)
MKKTALIIAALAAVGISYAADNVNVTTKPSYSVTSDFSYTSEYVFRGLKNSNAAFQGSIEVGQDDFRAGFWTSQPVNSRQFNNEFDFYAGYKFRVSKSLSTDIVGTYYYYPEAVTGSGFTHHSYELGVGATFDLGAASPALTGLSTSLYYYYDFRLEQQTLQTSLGYSLALKDYGTSLDFSVFAGQVCARNGAPDSSQDIYGNQGKRVRESYFYYGIGLNVPYKLTENAQVHVGASFSGNEKYLYRAPGSFLVPRQDIAISAGVTLGF